MDKKSRENIIICFIHPALGIKGWKRSKIYESEVSRIHLLFQHYNHYRLVFLDRSFPMRINPRKNIILYAPSIYSVKYLILFYLYNINQKKIISKILRIGYIPSITHFKNKRYYSSLKAILLEYISSKLFNKIYLVEGNNSFLYNNSSNVTRIQQNVSRSMFYPITHDTLLQKHKILFVGRLEHEKGANLLLSKPLSKFDITVVGKGELSKNLQKKDNLKLTGQLDSINLSKLYALSKINLNLSPSEGMPKSVIEASANGCFSIVRRSSFEIPNYCRDFIFEYTNLNEIPSLVENLLNFQYKSSHVYITKINKIRIHYGY